MLRGLYFEKCRRIVVRMDLLPDKEMIYFTRLGLFGNLYGESVGLDDLEKVEYEDIVNTGKQ